MVRISSESTSSRTKSAFVTGAISLVGGSVAGSLAFRAYLGFVDGVDPAVDLVGAMFSFVGHLLAAALMAMVGFIAGSIASMTVEWAIRRAPRMLAAVGLAFIFEAVALPVAAFLVVWLDGTSVASPVWLWVAIVTVGGLLPGLARWLTFRELPDSVATAVG